MAEDLKSAVVAFRLSHEMRAGVDLYCEANSISITDLFRALTEMVLGGQISPGSIEGFKSAQALAIQLAGVLLAQAAATLPATIDEARARGLVI